MIRLFTFVFAASIIWCGSSAQAQPSSNCKRASSPVEQMICADPSLLAEDRLMDRLYPIAVQRHPDWMPENQYKQWLVSRNSCSDIRCIRNKYETYLPEIIVSADYLGSKMYVREDGTGELRVFSVSSRWLVIFIDATNGDVSNDGAYAAEEEWAFALQSPSMTPIDIYDGCQLRFDNPTFNKWKIVYVKSCRGRGAGGVALEGEYDLRQRNK